MRTQSLPCPRVSKMTIPSYRLPNGTIPVLLSADTRDLLHAEAAALLSYAADHPEVSPQEDRGNAVSDAGSPAGTEPWLWWRAATSWSTRCRRLSMGASIFR